MTFAVLELKLCCRYSGHLNHAIKLNGVIVQLLSDHIQTVLIAKCILFSPCERSFLFRFRKGKRRCLANIQRRGLPECECGQQQAAASYSVLSAVTAPCQRQCIRAVNHSYQRALVDFLSVASYTMQQSNVIAVRARRKGQFTWP